MDEFISKLSKTKAKKNKAVKMSIVDAQGEQCFWVNFGPVVKNLVELKKAIEEMSDEQFEYHTKRDGNDFVKWIENVLGEKELAMKLIRSKTRKSFAAVLEKHLSLVPHYNN